MVDRELVKQKIGLILNDLVTLDELAKRPLEAYRASATDQLCAERLLQRAIGRLVDLNYHLLTESGEPPPSDYYVSFIAMGNAGIVPRAFASLLAPASGLLIRLVHDYGEIDHRAVHMAISSLPAEVRPYLGAIQGFLDGASSSS